MDSGFVDEDEFVDFSTVENAVEKYESGEFEAGGYKWKLVVYPNGNKKKNVKDYFSLYLTMANTSSLSFGWEVYVVFRLFLLDQHKDRFLILQEAMGDRRFHGLKLEWGFDKFIQFTAFNDASNGYLVEDTCVFGADVFVKERNKNKGECLSMMKNTSASSYKHVWKIDNFSKLEAKCYDSEVFVAGDQKWKIRLYPKGNNDGTGSRLSMYLALADLSTITQGFKTYVDFTLRIQAQVQAKHKDCETRVWFKNSIEDWGFTRFVELSYLNDASNGCLVKDVCTVEAEVTVLGISKAL